MTMKMCLTLTAVVLLFALAPVANCGTIQIQYQVDLGPIVTCAAPTPGPVNCSNVVGPPLRITSLGADSNSPGTATIANETAADVDLINFSSSTQSIQIQISATDFTLPSGSGISLLSHVGGTVVVGSVFSDLSFQSCIDPTNSLKPISSSGVACAVGTFASGLSAPSITSAGAFADTKTVTIGPLAGPYSITESFFINLAPSEELNWSSSTSLTAAAGVPEPGSLMLILGAGLVGLGAFGRKRLVRK